MRYNNLSLAPGLLEIYDGTSAQDTYSEEIVVYNFLC